MRKRRLHQLAFCLALSLYTSATLAGNSAAQTVRNFYSSIQKQDCEKAIKLRHNYSLAKCAKIDAVYLHKVIDKESSGDYAVVYLEIDTESSAINHYFSGYTRLQKVNNQWLIVGPYKNAQDYTLDEYRAEFVTERREDKPINSVTSGQAKELPSGDVTLDHKHANNTVKFSDNPATEFVAPDSPITQTANTRKAGKLLSKQPHNTEESVAFAKGEIPLEGNFMALLRALREIFRDEEQDIILIDQSQSLFYFYNSNNQLSGLYPVLSSNLSNIPKGLYILLFEPSLDNTAMDSNNFMLEKMVIAPNNNFLLGEIHYIRDYFDTDQKNSLALSPIDIKKLQKMLSSDTIVYIAK